MSNEKYINAYVDVLTNVMQDAIIKNVSLQANAKISEDIIKEQSEEITRLQVMIANLNEKENTIDTLKEQLKNYHSKMKEYENIKHQVNHLDLFRNELIKEREEHKITCDNYESIIKQLNEKIDFLQLTPTKQKKIDDAKVTKIETKKVDTFQEASSMITKDGGSF